jgi:hypothetical protein
MSSGLMVPLLSEKDDAERSEGGIDPLGLEAIADSLGTRLVPGVRERQTHPRYLTAIAVGLAVCERFDEGTVAADGVSEPWQVFEWYLVEGLVRTAESGRTRGVPGSLKASKAIADKVPLSARRYLKTPSVFGFHGIYRLLARTLGVEQGERLGDFGFELLEVWSKERGLNGFIGTGDGPGQAVRQLLFRAIEDGLERGAVARMPGWAGWNYFREFLDPLVPGDAEAALILRELLEDSKGFRTPTIKFLTSSAGQSVWKESSGSERAWHEALRSSASAELQRLLDAISLYERFCRLCQDAFDDCLCEMTRTSGRISPTQLGKLPSLQKASREVPSLFFELLDRLHPFGQAGRLRDACQSLATICSPTEWAILLTDHHRDTQHRKPPDGKQPWFERFDDGSLILRPLYKRETPGQHDDSYLHAYRTSPLWSFVTDLRAVS